MIHRYFPINQNFLAEYLPLLAPTLGYLEYYEEVFCPWMYNIRYFQEFVSRVGSEQLLNWENHHDQTVTLIFLISLRLIYSLCFIDMILLCYFISLCLLYLFRFIYQLLRILYLILVSNFSADIKTCSMKSMYLCISHIFNHQKKHFCYT